MPHDVFILGCGRSGTSLLAGLFRTSGYFQGSRFIPPTESNPRGFFEDLDVNDINETILRPLVSPVDAFEAGQRWLARIAPETEIPPAPESGARIAAVLKHRPFCLKDPRFCYTLHLWRAQAPTARMICAFRPPRVVVASILKHVATAPYLQGFTMSVEQAFATWRLMYSHVLARHAVTGDWLFVEYQDVFKPPILDRIARFCEASIDSTFADPGLNRSKAVTFVDADAENLYSELVARSKATLDRIEPRTR